MACDFFWVGSVPADLEHADVGADVGDDEGLAEDVGSLVVSEGLV